MIETAKNLPTFDDSILFNNQGIWDYYNKLNHELNSLREKELEINTKINDIEQANEAGSGFVGVLEELKEKTEIAIPDIESNYTCPLCGNACTEINKIDKEVLRSSLWLDEELETTSKYTSDFSEDIRKLSKIRDDIIDDFKLIGEK